MNLTEASHKHTLYNTAGGKPAKAADPTPMATTGTGGTGGTNKPAKKKQFLKQD